RGSGMGVCAVRYEPVSAVNSVLSGNYWEKLAILASFEACRGNYLRSFRPFAEFRWNREQGILVASMTSSARVTNTGATCTAKQCDKFPSLHHDHATSTMARAEIHKTRP